MGVSGSGKTTVGTTLADAMHCLFLEGDSLHSVAKVGKMRHGIPLTDADRAPWLVAIHARLLDAFTHGARLVVGYSALKQSYRMVLAEGILSPGRISTALRRSFDRECSIGPAIT